MGAYIYGKELPACTGGTSSFRTPASMTFDCYGVKTTEEMREVWWKTNARTPTQRVETLGKGDTNAWPMLHTLRSCLVSVPGTSIGEHAVQVLCHHVVL